MSAHGDGIAARSIPSVGEGLSRRTLLQMSLGLGYLSLARGGRTEPTSGIASGTLAPAVEVIVSADREARLLNEQTRPGTSTHGANNRIGALRVLATPVASRNLRPGEIQRCNDLRQETFERDRAVLVVPTLAGTASQMRRTLRASRIRAGLFRFVGHPELDAIQLDRAVSSTLEENCALVVSSGGVLPVHDCLMLLQRSELGAHRSAGRILLDRVDSEFLHYVGRTEALACRRQLANNVVRRLESLQQRLWLTTGGFNYHPRFECVARYFSGRVVFAVDDALPYDIGLWTRFHATSEPEAIGLRNANAARLFMT